jgi:hypothetical protein
MKTLDKIKKRLETLKKKILSETISYGEITELQSLAKYINDDVILLEWAGVKENEKRNNKD